MNPAEQLSAALAGRYTIDRLVGAGGMATVYLARDLRHQRNVALKVLKADLGAVVGVDRFLAEIQVTANLQHPNLLPLFDSGAADGLLFYVMPYIEGESLRHRIDREKQLPIDEAVRISTAVASALDYAHRHGVIHRDLKPENILLHEGQPLVADFGIALAVSNAGGDRITQTGLSLGTPQYMSPEQASGDRVIDGRTDIYSLGAVTYEMLTGEAPHSGTTSQAIIARLMMERPRPIRTSRPNVPEHVEAAVDCALEKLPADRFATAKEFSEALAGSRVLTRRTTAATTAGTTAPAPRQRPATRELIAWGLALVGIAAGVMATIRASRPETPLVTSEFEIALPDSLVTTSTGTQAALSLSRDGSTLVFHASRPGLPTTLYVRQLRDRTVQPIRGTENGRAPVLSPDGSEVLFTLATTGGAASALKRVSIRGGTPRTVVDSVSANGQVSWGDAQEIVYAVHDSLFVAAESGGQPRLLAAPDSARGHVRYGWPDVLPGGKAALITIWKGEPVVDSAFIGVVTIPGGRVTEPGLRGTYPRYSESGHVLFVTKDGLLNAVPFSLSSHAVTGAVAPVAEDVRFGTGGAAGVTVARNGTLAYVSGPPSTVGLLIPVAVSRAGVERELGLRAGYYRWPRLSPDGRQIAFTTFTGPAPGGGGIGGGRGRGPAPNPDIWRYDLSARVLSRVTTDSASERPMWSFDGERIAYVGGDTTIMSRPLYATGQAATHVAWNRSIAEFDMHRNGYLVIRSAVGNPGRGRGGGRGQADVFVAHVDSATAPRALLNAAYQEVAPRISPDGRLIAYMSNRTGRFEVYVRPLFGDGPEVSVSADLGSDPVWSRDGREIFYRGTNHVMSAQVTTTPRLAVTGRDALFLDIYSSALGDYDIFPDGREFVMLRNDVPQRVTFAPLIVVLNWHRSRGQTR